MKIVVYAAEAEAGLADAVGASASLAYLTPIGVVSGDDAAPIRTLHAAASADDADLFFLRDVLVSAGWNRNDDVFAREEVWSARHSSDDKPLNFQHDRTDVIGHIVSSYAVDADFAPIPDDAAEADLPERFHVVNGTVIYRIFNPKNEAETARAGRIERTIGEIAAGEWFVSMECYLSDFDYAVVDPEGVHHVVARGEDTAWLTKYLRAYQPDAARKAAEPRLGSGTYADASTGREYRVGRLLRGITFSGKGLVRKPANPDSIIFNSVANFTPSPDDPVYLLSESSRTPEADQMSDTSDELQRQLADANQTIASLNEQIDAFKAQGAAARISALEADLASRGTEVANLTSQLDAVREAAASLTGRAEAAESSLATANSELSAIRAERLAAARVALAVEKGAEPAVASTLVSRLSGLDDAAYADTLDVLAPSWRAAAPAPKDGPAIIDEAVPEPDVALATASAPADDASAVISDYFARNFSK